VVRSEVDRVIRGMDGEEENENAVGCIEERQCLTAVNRYGAGQWLNNCHAQLSNKTYQMETQSTDQKGLILQNSVRYNAVLTSGRTQHSTFHTARRESSEGNERKEGGKEEERRRKRREGASKEKEGGRKERRKGKCEISRKKEMKGR
jgi:hypothetical protein